MRVGNNNPVFPTERLKSAPMAQTANSGVKTDDNVVTNDNGNLTQTDLEGAYKKAIETNDSIYIQTNTGSDEFVKIDLSKPENRQMVEGLLNDLKAGNPVSLDATFTELLEVKEQAPTDPYQQISLKDGEDTIDNLKDMGINLKDGIDAEEGQKIIDKLKSEGATGAQVSKIQSQINKKLDKYDEADSFKLKFDKKTGEYSFQFTDREQVKTRDGHFKWKDVQIGGGGGSGKVKHKGGPADCMNWGKSKGSGGGGGPMTISVPKWKPPLFRTEREIVSGSTDRTKQTEKTGSISFNVEPTPRPENYTFDFPNFYDNNRTAIEDKTAFKEQTQSDNATFDKLVNGNPDLNIVIRADGSRNYDRPDWKTEYSKDELQSQRSIKGNYDNESNTFEIRGTASAAPGSGTYRTQDVPVFARDLITPGETPVHNDTLALFRSINAYTEFVRNADPATKDALEEKKVTFEINPQVREHLQQTAPELLQRLDAGLSWRDMIAVKF